MDRESLEALRELRDSAYKTYVARLGESPLYREVVLASMAAPTLPRGLAESAARYTELAARVTAEEQAWSDHLADSQRREAEGRALAEAAKGERA